MYMKEMEADVPLNVLCEVLNAGEKLEQIAVQLNFRKTYLAIKENYR